MCTHEYILIAYPFLKEAWYPNKLNVKGLLANRAVLAPLMKKKKERKLPGKLNVQAYSWSLTGKLFLILGGFPENHF